MEATALLSSCAGLLLSTRRSKLPYRNSLFLLLQAAQVALEALLCQERPLTCLLA